MTHPADPPHIDPQRERPPSPFNPHTYPVGTTEFAGSDDIVLGRIDGYVPLTAGATVIFAENQLPNGITTGLVSQAILYFEGGKATLRYYLNNAE